MMMKILLLAAIVAVTAAADVDYPKIRDFESIDATLNSITLSWSLDVSEYTPAKYTLIVDETLTMEFFHDGTNVYTVTGLSSCNLYAFDLKADYADGDTTDSALAMGSTQDEMPGDIEGLLITGNTLTWNPPTNSRCIDFYNVCYTSAVTGYSGCQPSLDPSYDLSQVSGCDDVDVSVAGVAGDLEGPNAEIEVKTDYGTPGKPRNYEVTVLSETSVELAWDSPLDNPACVIDYTIRYGEMDDPRILEIVHIKPEEDFDDEEHENEEDFDEDHDKEEVHDDESRLGPSGQEYTAILDNLSPCTEYHFGVSTVSQNNEHSDEVIIQQTTEGTAPGQVPDISYDKEENSITITWGDVSAETCMKEIQICYSDAVEIHTECVEVPKEPNTWTLDGLKACREYDFMIRGQTSDGESGPPIYISVSTNDVAPGPVREMHLGSIGVTSLTVTYMDPLQYPECVEQYVITYRNLLDEPATKDKTTTKSSNYTDQINGLDACGLYEVGVYAVSASGLEGEITLQNTAMKETIPEPPITGTMVTSTNSTATLLWYAPEDTRFCVDSYTVKISQPGGAPGISNEVVDVTGYNEEVLHTVPGLGPCTGYVAEIKATNDNKGSSAFDQVINDIMTAC